MGAIAMMMSGAATAGGGSAVPPNTNLGSNLFAWYKLGTGIYDAVSGGSLVTTNAQEIGRWEDQSGNGYHLTRSTAIGTGNLQWSTAVTDRGSGTVHFMGDTNAYFNIPETFRTAAQGNAALEMWVRIINASDAGGNGAWFIGGSNDCHFLWSDGVWYDNFFSASGRRTVGNPTLDTSTAFRVVDLYSISGEWAALLDNSVVYSDAINTPDNATTGWHFGRSINTYALSSWVSEIVFSKAKATTTQRNNMYTYLTT